MGPLLTAPGLPLKIESNVAAVGVLPKAGELVAETDLPIPGPKPAVAEGTAMPSGVARGVFAALVVALPFSLVGVPPRRRGFIAGSVGGAAARPSGRACGRPTSGTLLVEEMKVGSEIMFLLTVMRRGRPPVGCEGADEPFVGVARPLLANRSGVERPLTAGAEAIAAADGIGNGEVGGGNAGEVCALYGVGPALRYGDGAPVASAGLCNGTRGDGRGACRCGDGAAILGLPCGGPRAGEAAPIM
jgi:hypothetical protein